MRVFLADDQEKVRSALRLLLEQEPELSVVGEASEATELLARVVETRPDLVLLDWELPGLTPDLLLSLHTLHPQLLVVALSSRLGAYRAALAAGVDAFASKCAPPERLLAALNECRNRQQRT